MNQNLDLIATVQVDISTPVASQGSFDSLLIVGPLPKVAPANAPALCGVYNSLAEVNEAGWVSEGLAANLDPVGVAAKIAFSQSPAPSRIYIAPIQVAVVEEVATPESAAAAVNRALSTDGWYAVCPAGVAASEYGDIASLIETTHKVFCYTETAAIASGGMTPTVTTAFDRTIGIYGKESGSQTDANMPDVNKYMNVAFMAKYLQYQSGTETAAHKKLSAVLPSEFSTSEISAILTANLNYFTTVGGKTITMNGKVLSGEWIDVIRFRDWLQNDMQVRVVNLFMVNPKISLNDAGIALIENQMIASLRSGQNIGGIAEDEFDEDGEVIPGFTVTVPEAASLSDTEKASRSLENFQFTARLLGAIHFVEIKGNLVYSM